MVLEDIPLLEGDSLWEYELDKHYCWEFPLLVGQKVEFALTAPYDKHPFDLLK